MNQQNALRGREIIVLLMTFVVLVAVILIVVTSALNGFLGRFSRDSLQAIAVLLIYALPIGSAIGVLIGYAWHAARERRALLPPAPAPTFEQRPAPPALDSVFSSEGSTPLTLDESASQEILNLLRGNS